MSQKILTHGNMESHSLYTLSISFSFSFSSLNFFFFFLLDITNVEKQAFQRITLKTLPGTELVVIEDDEEEKEAEQEVGKVANKEGWGKIRRRKWRMKTSTGRRSTRGR